VDDSKIRNVKRLIWNWFSAKKLVSSISNELITEEKITAIEQQTTLEEVIQAIGTKTMVRVR